MKIRLIPLASFVLSAAFITALVLTMVSDDLYWHSPHQQGTTDLSLPILDRNLPAIKQQTHSRTQPSQQGPDAIPLKTDRNQNDEPRNKLLDSAGWQSWLALPAAYKAKVDPRLLAELRGEILPAYLGGTADGRLQPPSDEQALEKTRFIVVMKEQVNLRHKLSQSVYASSVEQKAAAVDFLTATAVRTQTALAATLVESMTNGDVNGYHSFFIVNAMAVEGNLETIVALALRDDVDRIQASYPLVSRLRSSAPPRAREDSVDRSRSLEASHAAQSPDSTTAPSALAPGNWNIDLVGADEVWNVLRVRGEGAVVAGFDSGVEYTHPALNNNYRGKIAENQYDHNYSWFAPDTRLYPDGNLGASLTDEPYDCDSYGTHGTHTMGTMVGSRLSDDSFRATDIGMAPRAKWIAVPGICPGTMPDGLADDIGGLKAFQWLLCPTDLSGDLSTADCSKAPDVVNNSWGSANPVNDVLHPAIEALRAAGIAPVFAAGNPGAGEGSIGTPANSPAAITVGATDIDDQIASFSGRGPSFYAGEQKPELSAPGVRVRSSILSSFYDSYSGTSMAAPHVAGLVALMVSADLQDGVRDFSVDDLERFMTYSAVDLGPKGADNDYGHGRIDAFKAVSWVQSAGDLRGTIVDAATGEPIPHAVVEGVDNERSFRSQSGGSGVYSVTVPAGSYNITVEAWGYESATFSQQTVFAGSLSYADFQLSPLAAMPVSGIVRTGAEWSSVTAPSVGPTSGASVANAQLSVVGNPTLTTTTAANGSYSLTLPSGTHELIIRAERHRTMTATVSVGASAQTLDLNPNAAPKILLVDADAHGGWFSGWPVYPIFEYVLNRARYPYDLWRVQHLDVTDTQPNPADGSTDWGVPSLTTLQQYDLVLWVHSGCGDYYCFVGGSPQGIEAEDLLVDYLEGGGLLILSGQNISSWTRTTSQLLKLLGSEHVETAGAQEGTLISGAAFLDDLAVEITNASLYGYRNGLLYLSPDVVKPRAENAIAQPILTYEEGGSAALAVSPCAADYRSVFFALGYENLGPRADNRDPDAIEIMDRAIQWLADTKKDYALSISPRLKQEAAHPGDSMQYELSIVNTGRLPANLRLDLTNQWSTSIFSGTIEANRANDERQPLDLTQNLSIQPCTTRSLTVEIDVPKTASNGERDVTQINLTFDGAIDLTPAEATQSVTLTTLAFARWEIQPAMPTARYRLAVEALPEDIYVYTLGGWTTDFAGSITTNERFNTCTNEWETMAPLPRELLSSNSVVYNGKIYLTGGFSFSYFTYLFDALKDVHIYDPATNSWDRGPDLTVGHFAHAIAAYNNKFYLFGGTDSNGEDLDTVYEYDPASGAWGEKAPIPGGARAFAEAVVLNDKIYLIGGWPNERRVEVYDPASNSWSEAAALQFGRQSPGVTVADDGYIYVAGGGAGWEGTDTVERFTPSEGRWEIISSVRNQNRVGGGLAYTTGRLYLVGGYLTTRTNESLTLGNSFCLSDKQSTTPISQPGGTLSFSVNINSDTQTIPAAQVIDRLPLSTTFVGFDTNAIGATYNSSANQIEWRGTVPANGVPLNYSYTVALNNISWENGTILSSDARFSSGDAEQASPGVESVTGVSSGLSFTRTALSSVYIPDFMASSLAASANSVIEGENLTYTVNIMSTNAAGGPVVVTSTLPASMEYVVGSLTSTVGEGNYARNTRTLTWSGVVAPDQNAFLNRSDNFVWYDSDGETNLGSESFTATYDWIEISETGQNVASGDDRYVCGFDIGFQFPYYGQTHSNVCVSTNGFISFDAFGFSNYYNECPLPGIYTGMSLIAGMWNDLIVDAVYVQTIGTEPNRALVVQFVHAQPYYFFFDRSDDFSEFEIILYESGEIKIQFKEVDSEKGASSTTGVSNFASGLGSTYACNSSESLHDELAVVFTPPGGGLGNASTQLSFAVAVGAGLPVNSTISNTVQIADSFDVYTRSATTELNPIGLEIQSDLNGTGQVEIGGQIDYQFILRNTGRFPAKEASLVFPIRPETSYIADSLSCSSGSCLYTADELITWNGRIDGRSEVIISLGALLSEQLPDRTSFTSVATVSDGLGNSYEIPTTITARSSDLRNSVTILPSIFIEKARQTVIELVVRNTGTVQTESRAEIRIPAGTNVVEGSLICGTGQCLLENERVSWQGVAFPRSAIPIRFAVTIPEDADYGDSYLFGATLTDINRQEVIELSQTLIVARQSYFPVLYGPASPTVIYMPVVPKFVLRLNE